MTNNTNKIPKKLIFWLSTTIYLLCFIIYLLNNINIKNNKDYNSNNIITNNDDSYNRDDWTSNSQYYKCDNKNHKHNENNYNGDDNGEFTSIRAYSYYESKWYNWKTDTYTDPYNGSIINSIKETDYDHIIPLAYANAHGANKWTNEEKKAYADDSEVGICCNYSDNRSKGAKGPSEWLPEKNVEDYCYTWLYISNKYNLTLSQSDYDTIMKVLNGADMNQVSLINKINKY